MFSIGCKTKFLVSCIFLYVVFASNSFSWIIRLCLTVFGRSKQPNILLIVADDYGFHDVGYHGSEINTPNLDKLARGGVRLENYYVQPICTPTRSQLLSGRYQIHTGLQHGVIWPSQPNGLPLDSPTIADKLRAAGYSTHAVGKWHVGMYTKDYIPTSRGFDTYYGYLTGSEDYFTHYQCYNKMCGYDLRDNLDPVTNANNTYSTHLFAERVINIINYHNDEKPLFIYLPFQAVHGPLQVPESYEKPYSHIQDRNRRTYAGMVSCMDEAIGNITEAMKQKGIWDNTVLAFSTDNGAANNAGGSNWPLRGWKGSMWEGAIRGVGFVHSNLLSNKAQGSISDGLMHVTDWFPTFVGIAKGNLNGNKRLDGYNQWGMINEGSASPRKEILHNIDPLICVGEPMPNVAFNTSIRAALRVGELKIITGFTGKNTQQSLKGPKKSVKNVWLFNISKDPYERNDLSEEMPDMVRTMLKKMREYELTAVPARYPANDPMSNPKFHGGYWGPWR